MVPEWPVYEPSQFILRGYAPLPPTPGRLLGNPKTAMIHSVSVFCYCGLALEQEHWNDMYAHDGMHHASDKSDMLLFMFVHIQKFAPK